MFMLCLLVVIQYSQLDRPASEIIATVMLKIPKLDCVLGLLGKLFHVWDSNDYELLST